MQTCPVCNLPMNAVNKTSEKSPDWKCSNPNCKFEWNKSTQTYVPSRFVTSVWNRTFAPKPSFQPQKPPVGPYNANQGQSKGGFEQSMDVTVLLQAILEAINKINAKINPVEIKGIGKEKVYGELSAEDLNNIIPF